MASPATLELKVLLQPVSEEAPAGENLREDISPTSTYYQIRDIRSAARASERQGLFEGVIGPAESGAWRPIVEMAPDVLAQRSKDLEVVGWLIEALARTHGFAGMRDGFHLARELVERYWDGLYPLPDEDGLETKVAPITGLNGAGGDGTLIVPIARIPVVQGSSVGPFATWNCNQARELDRMEELKRQERLAAGATSNEMIRTAVAETPVPFFVDLVEDIEQCIEEWGALGRKLDERCGADGPPTSNIRNALQEALDRIREIAGDVLPVEPEPAGAGAEGGGEAAAAPGGTGSLATREDAFRTLLQVSEFFRRTEPHSPLSFLIERTVRWGRMPLPKLVSELIPDQNARSTYEQLTGVLKQGSEPDA